MRKKFIIFLLLVLCIGVCGCETNNNNQNEDHSNMYESDDITSTESNSENFSNEIQFDLK